MLKETFTCPGFNRKKHKCKPSEFYRDSERRGGGHSYYCKECHKARNKEYWKEKYYPKNREDLIEVNKERQKNKPPAKQKA